MLGTVPKKDKESQLIGERGENCLGGKSGKLQKGYSGGSFGLGGEFFDLRPDESLPSRFW